MEKRSAVVCAGVVKTIISAETHTPRGQNARSGLVGEKLVKGPDVLLLDAVVEVVHEALPVLAHKLALFLG